MFKNKAIYSHKLSCFCLIIMSIYFVIAFVDYLIFQYSGNHVYSMFDLYGFLYFCVDYSNGLVSRGLCGEVTKLLFSNSTNFVVEFITIKSILIGILYSSIIGFGIWCYIKRKDTIVFALSFICIRPLYLLSKIYTIRPDHFWYVCLFIIVILLFNDVKFNRNMILVLLLSIIAMLFHHAFIFVFSPLVCLILYDKKSMKWFLLYSGIMCIEFLLMTLLFKGDYQYICNHVVKLMHEFGLWDNYGSSVFKSDIISALDMEYNSSRLLQVVSYPGLLEEYITKHIPLLGIYVLTGCGSLCFSWNIISNYARNGRSINFITMIIFLPFLMLLIFTVDCDRWFLMILTSLNIFSMYLLLKNKVTIDINFKWYCFFVISILFQIVVYMLF